MKQNQNQHQLFFLFVQNAAGHRELEVLPPALNSMKVGCAHIYHPTCRPCSQTRRVCSGRARRSPPRLRCHHCTAARFRRTWAVARLRAPPFAAGCVTYTVHIALPLLHVLLPRVHALFITKRWICEEPVRVEFKGWFLSDPTETVHLVFQQITFGFLQGCL